MAVLLSAEAHHGVHLGKQDSEASAAGERLEMLLRGVAAQHLFDQNTAFGPVHWIVSPTRYGSTHMRKRPRGLESQTPSLSCAVAMTSTHHHPGDENVQFKCSWIPGGRL